MRLIFAVLIGVVLPQEITFGSETDPVSLSCNPQSLPYLDTTIGYSLPVPDGFEAVGDPPMRLQSTLSLGLAAPSETAGFVAIIWVKVFAYDELENLRVLEVDHPKARGLTIRYDLIANVELQTAQHAYALTIGDNSLLINSSRPINLSSLFECLI